MASDYVEKSLTVKLPDLGDVTFIGNSRAAHWTGFWVPSCDILLDAGIRFSCQVSNIFITHGHHDHAANSHFLILGNEKIPTFHIHEKCTELLDQFIKSGSKLNNASEYTDIHKTYSIEPHKFYFDERRKKHKTDNQDEEQKILDELDRKNLFSLDINGRPWTVDVINCHHGVPCLGYVFARTVKKVKPDIAKLDKKEIASIIKEKGDDAFEMKRCYMWCFLGDTMSNVLLDPRLANYPLLFVECTFLFPEHKKEARKTKHMHWDDIKDYAHSHSDTIFVLIHFSERYSDRDIMEFFKDKTELNNYVKDRDKDVKEGSIEVLDLKKKREPNNNTSKLGNVILWI
jgi:ribonuclease Z